MKDEHRIRFEAECCVEILRAFNLRARIEAKLPAGSTFMAKAVSYLDIDVGGKNGKSHSSSRYEYGDVKAPM